jgi:hypothetical protein
MNIFRQLSTYFSKPEPVKTKPQPALLSSNSFEIITSDIIDDYPAEEFVILG